jgi:Tfp pilus assembly protein PilN
MRELALDYQSKPPFPLIGVVLLLFSLLVLFLIGTDYKYLAEQVSLLDASVKRATTGRAANGLPRRTTQQNPIELAKEVSNANDVLRKLSVPWEDLFRAVELSGGNKVTLLALEPEIENRQVKIRGETRDYKALLNYVTRLQSQPVLGSVYLQNHQIQLQDTEKPVRFSIVATWQEKP